MPLGVYHHHHVAVSEAALSVLTDKEGPARNAEWYVYAETPYTQHYPELTDERLARLREAVILDEINLVQDPPELRIEAVDAYVTQLPLLRALLPHLDEDLRGDEPYWRATPTTRGTRT
jgi:hypothetical protein